MAQRFLAPEVVFEGLIKQVGNISNDQHVITRGYLHGNVINGIHPDSANYASVVSDNGVNKLKIDPLTITSVTVNNTATDLSDFIANVYTGSNFQEGDIVFLTAPSPTVAYIHNGGTNADENDWELVNSGLSDAQIRAKFSASAGIDYNSSTGEFTADQAEIKAFFSAGTGLSYANGQFSLNATSDQVSEGQTNLYYKDSLVAAYLYGGTGITFNNGQISFTGSSDDVSEGQTNLYFENQRVWDSLGVATVTGPNVQLAKFDSVTGEFSVELTDVFAEFSAGTGLTFNGGEFALNATTDDIQQLQGATNKFYSDSLVDAHLSGGTAITYNAGQISFTGSSDDVSEGTTNLYYESQRVYDDIGVSADADELIAYDNTKGEFTLRLSKLRQSFTNQSLTANTALTLTHNLGQKLVHVAAMDGQSEAVDLKVVYVSTTQVAITSTINLSGIDIAVSL